MAVGDWATLAAADYTTSDPQVNVGLWWISDTTFIVTWRDNVDGSLHFQWWRLAGGALTNLAEAVHYHPASFPVHRRDVWGIVPVSATEALALVSDYPANVSQLPTRMWVISLDLTNHAVSSYVLAYEWPAVPLDGTDVELAVGNFDMRLARLPTGRFVAYGFSQTTRYANPGFSAQDTGSLWAVTFDYAGGAVSNVTRSFVQDRRGNGRWQDGRGVHIAPFQLGDIVACDNGAVVVGYVYGDPNATTYHLTLKSTVDGHSYDTFAATIGAFLVGNVAKYEANKLLLLAFDHYDSGSYFHNGWAVTVGANGALASTPTPTVVAVGGSLSSGAKKVAGAPGEPVAVYLGGGAAVSTVDPATGAVVRGATTDGSAYVVPYSWTSGNSQQVRSLGRGTYVAAFDYWPNRLVAMQREEVAPHRVKVLKAAATSQDTRFVRARRD